MKKSILLTIKICVLLTLFSATFISCKKNKTPIYDASSIDLVISPGIKDDLSSKPSKWHVTNKRIIVLFGYDFNTTEQTTNLLALLEENYGLDSQGGLIYPLIYPNSFKHGIRAYASDFSTILNDFENEISGIIILGAPENTHKALAKNQDKWNQEMPYPVVALFPQDDVLGIESTCDIVIDKGQTKKDDDKNGIGTEETEVQIISDAPAVLMQTIEYVRNLNYSLPKNNTISLHVAQMLQGRNIHHYADSETGLKSINHFVID